MRCRKKRAKLRKLMHPIYIRSKINNGCNQHYYKQLSIRTKHFFIVIIIIIIINVKTKVSVKGDAA